MTPYGTYKPSGIGWIRDIPEHWQLKRLKCIAHRSEVKVEPDDDIVLPYVGLEHIEPWKGRLLGVDEALVRNAGSSRFEVGDTLFGKLRPYLAKACNVDFQGVCSSELLVLRGTTCDRGFLLYLLLSPGFISLVDSSTYGSKMPRANWDFIGTCELPLPPVEEQRAIARFLDSQTARIDTLVAKKWELIEKLKEKRSTLVDRTVVGGLPAQAAMDAGLEPRPEMKNSEVEWLGKVAKHWQVKPLKHVAHIGNGSTPARDNADFWEDGVFPWLNSSAVNLENVTEATELVSTTALRMCHLPKIQPPAVLVGITGEGRTRGMATTLKIDATINQHIAFIKPMAARAEAGYLRRVMDRAYQFLRSESEGGGSTKGAITCDQISNMKVPVPPLAEQRAIAAYLENENIRLDNLTKKFETAIARLTEYRQSLITSAVTGQIDVRHWQAPALQAA